LADRQAGAELGRRGCDNKAALIKVTVEHISVYAPMSNMSNYPIPAPPRIQMALGIPRGQGARGLDR
jgi:hypothetical protein